MNANPHDMSDMSIPNFFQLLQQSSPPPNADTTDSDDETVQQYAYYTGDLNTPALVKDLQPGKVVPLSLDSGGHSLIHLIALMMIIIIHT